VQQAQKSLKLGPIKAALSVIEKRGVAGLWSGLDVTILGSSPSVAVYFGLYSTCKAHLTKILPPNMKLLAVALSASIGNSVASIIRAPYEVNLIRYIVQSILLFTLALISANPLIAGLKVLASMIIIYLYA
jgi:hypothetical protein